MSKARKFAGRGLVIGVLAGAAVAVGLLFAPAGLAIAGVGLGHIIGTAVVGGIAGGFTGMVGGGLLGSFFKEKQPASMDMTQNQRPLPIRGMGRGMAQDMGHGQSTGAQTSFQDRITEGRGQSADYNVR